MDTLGAQQGGGRGCGRAAAGLRRTLRLLAALAVTEREVVRPCGRAAAGIYTAFTFLVLSALCPSTCVCILRVHLFGPRMLRGEAVLPRATSHAPDPHRSFTAFPRHPSCCESSSASACAVSAPPGRVLELSGMLFRVLPEEEAPAGQVGHHHDLVPVPQRVLNALLGEGFDQVGIAQVARVDLVQHLPARTPAHPASD